MKSITAMAVILLASLAAAGTASAQDHAAKTKIPFGEDTKVVVNGHELSPIQSNIIQTLYRKIPPPGRYWYDSRSGAWGFDGHETAGFMLPGLDLGLLPANASHGDTGVFINGREINRVEALKIYAAFGGVYRGHWWLDGRTGFYGIEGNPTPFGNVAASMRSQHFGQSQDHFWCGHSSCGNYSGTDDKSGDYYSVDGHVLNTPF